MLTLKSTSEFTGMLEKYWIHRNSFKAYYKEGLVSIFVLSKKSIPQSKCQKKKVKTKESWVSHSSKKSQVNKKVLTPKKQHWSLQMVETWHE